AALACERARDFAPVFTRFVSILSSRRLCHRRRNIPTGRFVSSADFLLTRWPPGGTIDQSISVSTHRRRPPMARYVLLLKWTEQGIKNVKDTVKRASDAKALFEKARAKMTDCVWTLGPYDLVIKAEAPDDETMTAIAISLGKLGNVTTTTMRAFDDGEM